MNLKSLPIFSSFGRDEVKKIFEDISLGKIALKELVEQNNLSTEKKDEYEKQINYSKIARDKVVRGNLRLVASIAKKYTGYGVDFWDLFQEGVFGLMHAIDKFDVTRNIKFSTYTMKWIELYVKREIGNNSRAIRIPINKSDLLFSLNVAIKELEAIHFREPTIEEISNKMKIPKDKIEFLLNLPIVRESLNQTLLDDSEKELIDFIDDTSCEQLEEFIINQDFKKWLERIIDSNLDDTDAKIVKLRLGFIDGATRDFFEIGKVIGFSHQSAQYHYSKAINILSHLCISEVIRRNM